MQLNPARGRKLARLRCMHHAVEPVYAAQPREGTETRVASHIIHATMAPRFMQLNPARGRKRAGCVSFLEVIPWFMQLNPARGRKLRGQKAQALGEAQRGLCSSTPRGDGNNALSGQCPRRNLSRFMQLNPARGRKLQDLVLYHTICAVYAAQPREGTET